MRLRSIPILLVPLWMSLLFGCGGGRGGGGAVVQQPGSVSGQVLAPNGSLLSRTLPGVKAQGVLMPAAGVPVTLVRVDDMGQNATPIGNPTMTDAQGRYTLPVPADVPPAPNVCPVVGQNPQNPALSNIFTGGNVDITPGSTAATQRLYEQSRDGGIPVSSLRLTDVINYLTTALQAAANAAAGATVQEAISNARNAINNDASATSSLTTAVSSGGSSVPAGSGSVATGRQDLQQALSDRQLTEGDRSSLVKAQRNFEDVISRDPNNAEARAGLSIAQLALIALDSQVQSVPTLSRTLNVAQLPSVLTFQSISVSDFRDTLLGPIVALTRIVPTSARLSRVRQQATITGLQDVLVERILPTLVAIADHLAVANQNTNASIRILTDATENTLRHADLVILEAEIRMLAGLVAELGAYNLDPGSFYTNRGSTASFDSNGNRIVPPSEYVAPAPFATLRTDGAANLGTALTRLREAANLLESGVNLKLNESDDPSEIARLDAQSRTSLQNSLSVIAQVRQALTGVFAITINGTSVNANISAFFQNPIQDLRTVLPTIRLDANGNSLDLMISDFPDPTIHGVFPDGLPNSVFQ